MATLGGDARRKSILPDYKMLMRSDDGRFNHILYQAGPWAEWQARAPSQLAAHGIDGTNLWEATGPGRSMERGSSRALCSEKVKV